MPLRTNSHPSLDLDSFRVVSPLQSPGITANQPGPPIHTEELGSLASSQPITSHYRAPASVFPSRSQRARLSVPHGRAVSSEVRSKGKKPAKSQAPAENSTRAAPLLWAVHPSGVSMGSFLDHYLHGVLATLLEPWDNSSLLSHVCLPHYSETEAHLGTPR